MTRSIATADALENRLVFFDNAINEVLCIPNGDPSRFQQIVSMLSTNVSARYAFSIFRIILHERNREKILNLLKLLEYLIVTGSNDLRRYYGNAEFLEELHNLVQFMPADVVEAVIYFVHYSKYALTNFGSEMKHLEDFYRILKVEGHRFPDIKPSDMLVLPTEDVRLASPWIDGEYCEECHVKFSTFNRKHHCRYCGNVFCSKCTSKKSPIYVLNITENCRLCDHCYKKLNVSVLTDIVQKDYTASRNVAVSPVTVAATTQLTTPNSRNDASRQEEEDFAKAIELSLKEYNEKEAAKAVQVKNSVGTAPVRTEDYYLRQNEPSRNEYPTLTRVDRVCEDDGYVDEAFVKSCEETVMLIEQRLREARDKGLVLYKDVNLQAYIQALMAKQGQLQSLIQSNNAEQSKVSNILSKIELVEDARRSLDDIRRKYKINMKKQQDDTELLLRLQTEQKMEFMKKQRHENEEELRRLEEKHRRGIQSKMAVTSNRHDFQEVSSKSLYTPEQSTNVRPEHYPQLQQDYQRNDYPPHSSAHMSSIDHRVYDHNTSGAVNHDLRNSGIPRTFNSGNPYCGTSNFVQGASNMDPDNTTSIVSNTRPGFSAQNTSYFSNIPPGNFSYPPRNMSQGPSSYGEYPDPSYSGNFNEAGNFQGYQAENHVQSFDKRNPQTSYYGESNFGNQENHYPNQSSNSPYGGYYVYPQGDSYQQYQGYPVNEPTMQAHISPNRYNAPQHSSGASPQPKSTGKDKKNGSDTKLIEFE